MYYFCLMEKLNSVFFYQLEKAIKTYRQYAQGNLKRSGFDITIDQWLVLKALMDHEDISQSELAEIVFKDKASVTRIIELLVKNKYLRRDAHESRRRYKLTATERGRNIMRDIRPVVLKNRASALKKLTEIEIETGMKILKAIVSNCEKELIDFKLNTK